MTNKLPAAARVLLDSAATQARIAMDAYTAAEPSTSQIYLNGGLALEHAARAVLAAIHPALLAHPHHFESMLLLATHPDSLPTIAERVRTVGLADSLTRVSRVIDDFVPLEKALDHFRQGRNTVAHVGSMPSADIQADVVALLRALAAILEHLHESMAEFFAEYTPAVEERLSKSGDEMRAVISGRIGSAKRQFMQRWGNSPDDLDLGSSLHGRDWEEASEAQPYECPACDTEAVAYGVIDVDVDVEMDRAKAVAVRVPQRRCDTSRTRTTCTGLEADIDGVPKPACSGRRSHDAVRTR